LLRFTSDGRRVPFAVASTGNEGTGIAGERISVWCATCGKPVVLPADMRLGDVVGLLDADKRFRHLRCARER